MSPIAANTRVSSCGKRRSRVPPPNDRVINHTRYFSSCSSSGRAYDNDHNCTCAIADLEEKKSKHISRGAANDRYFLIVINNASHPSVDAFNSITFYDAPPTVRTSFETQWKWKKFIMWILRHRTAFFLKTFSRPSFFQVYRKSVTKN